MLIATLPPLYRDVLLREIVASPFVAELRYNTGMISHLSPRQTLEALLAIAREHDKKLWVDLKGRQLRIAQWAMPDYGRIVLNHKVTVDKGARAILRSGIACEIKFAKDNVIYLDGAPPEALGAGQSINIEGDFAIEGYSTESDLEYIAAARDLGIESFMLSYVEGPEDIAEVTNAYGKSCDLCLKIETPKGVTFVESLGGMAQGRSLMAARDDLYATIGDDKSAIIPALETIVRKDPNAIVASRVLIGVAKCGRPDLADLSDLELMRQMGYRHFMLSDEICHRHFSAAIEAWSAYIRRYPL